MAAAFLSSADEGNGSPPAVVADAVVRAVSTRRPKTSYVVGGGAKPMIAARRLLSDQAFDALMRVAARQMAKRDPG